MISGISPNTNGCAIGPPLPECSQTDKKYISDLITTLDDANLLTMGFKAGRLIEIGSHINHVHPLAFMQVAIGDSNLRPRIYRIFQSTLKRAAFMNGNGFTEGFGHRLDRASRKENLEPHAKWLAIALRIQPERITQLMQAHAWNDLFVHLCEKTAEQQAQKFRA